MAAIDSNILVGVLAIASVLAYIFVLRKMKTIQPKSMDVAITTSADEKAHTDHRETLEVQRSKKPAKKKPATECVRHFGYLSDLPKTSIIPKECLECGKMAKCISARGAQKKSRKPRSKRIDALPTVDEETEVLQEQ